MLPRLAHGMNGLVFLLISVFLMVTSILIVGVYIFIFNSVELKNKNSLKTPFSYSKIIEFIGLLVMVLISYSTSQIAMVLVTLGFTLYLIYNYIRNFPYPSREISLFYINSMSIFIINLALFIFYTQTLKTNQNNFLFISIIFSTIICAMNQTLWAYLISLINKYNILFKKNKDIRKQLLFFTTILELVAQSQKYENSYVNLQGLMNQHQIECKDSNCPCLSRFVEQKYKTEEQKQYELQLQQQALASIAIQEDLKLIKSKVKGIYMFELSQNRESYFQWILEFIDYHFSICIKNQKQDHHLEEFCIKFWYFQCKEKNNSIKSLYLVKNHSQLFQEKSLFFRIVQIAMTQLIENKIKEKDKSLRYSYRLKDTQEAIMYERFENFVLCEQRKVIIKQDIVQLIQKKVTYNEKLIEGYNSISELYEDIRSLMSNINKIEQVIQKELRSSKENIHFIRMLSLIKQRIVNDPSSCDKLETQLYDLKRRDEFQDKNIVHSITVLKGNVVSIIASFGGKEKGLILNYSDRTPQFFGYQSNEFYQINSVKQLMPYCVSKEHDLFIHRLIEKGTHNILRSYRTTLAKKKDGYFFPIRIYVNYYFGLQNDLCFSSLILKLQTNSHHILIDSQGYIQGVSEGFYKPIKAELYDQEGLNIDIIKSNIRLFCPAVSHIIEKYTETSDFTNFRCEFFFPKRHQELLKNFQQELLIFQNQTEKSDYASKKQQKKQSDFSKFMNEFLKKNEDFYEQSTLQFELSMNIEQDNIKLIDGRALILYVLEITTFTLNDKELTSTIGTTQQTKTTIFQKIYTQKDELYIQNKLDQSNNNNINEKILGSEFNQSPVNVIASQFTVKKVQQNQFLKNESQVELGLPTEGEINEEILNAHRQLPQHEIINSRQNIQGFQEEDIKGQDQQSSSQLYPTLNVISKRASIDYYQNDNIQKVYIDLEEQRKNILKQILKEENKEQITQAKKSENLERQENNTDRDKDGEIQSSKKTKDELYKEKRQDFQRQNSDRLKVQILTQGPDIFKEYQITPQDLLNENNPKILKDTRAQMLIYSQSNIEFPQIPQVKLYESKQVMKDPEDKSYIQTIQSEQNSPVVSKQQVQNLQASTRKYSLQVNPLIHVVGLSKQCSLQQSPVSSNNIDLRGDNLQSSHNILQTYPHEITQGMTNPVNTDMNNTCGNLNESHLLNKSNQGIIMQGSYLDKIDEAEINVNNEEFTEDTGNIKELVSEDDFDESNLLDQFFIQMIYTLNSLQQATRECTIRE